MLFLGGTGPKGNLDILQTSGRGVHASFLEPIGTEAVPFPHLYTRRGVYAVIDVFLEEGCPPISNKTHEPPPQKKKKRTLCQTHRTNPSAASSLAHCGCIISCASSCKAFRSQPSSTSHPAAESKQSERKTKTAPASFSLPRNLQSRGFNLASHFPVLACVQKPVSKGGTKRLWLACSSELSFKPTRKGHRAS